MAGLRVLAAAILLLGQAWPAQAVVSVIVNERGMHLPAAIRYVQQVCQFSAFSVANSGQHLLATLTHVQVEASATQCWCRKQTGSAAACICTKLTLHLQTKSLGVCRMTLKRSLRLSSGQTYGHGCRPHSWTAQRHTCSNRLLLSSSR